MAFACGDDDGGNVGPRYEVWGSDQSSEMAGADGVPLSMLPGSWIWIWDSADITQQLRGKGTAEPLGCDGNNRAGDGPCNLLDIFPSALEAHDSAGATGGTLADVTIGGLHGMLADPQNRYMNINLITPSVGAVGIIDGETKEAVALFQVTGTNVGRGVHMSFWNADGSALLVANINGKMLERIDIERDSSGKITNAAFNLSASIGLGAGLSIASPAIAYQGMNAHGNPLVSSITGDYANADLGDAAPSGKCKENGCLIGTDGALGGRPNNAVICPIVSSRNNVYVTFGGGRLLVVDGDQTPMTIVGEYGSQLIEGAGCGGVQIGDDMWLNAGVSGAGGGLTQSKFVMYALDDAAFSSTVVENSPAPTDIFKDAGNTATLGATTGDAENTTGQLPGTSTRRDAHGMVNTLDDAYLHNADRIQNNVEVFDAAARTHIGTYDLTSADGQGNGEGPCAAASVTDDSSLPTNDPGPDLMDRTPDGKYLVVALRGPSPVSVLHGAQGSCPGVGIIELTDEGASGHLVSVLRTTNTVGTTPVMAPGGHNYTGAERSDVHGASVRLKAP